mmetsp:Transcript_40800/g.93932  ORF Transcript_40800/g.93932 Transcript_40800/m.93932 type:complete len:214 (+) Transcript_40800:340-981(+)
MPLLKHESPMPWAVTIGRLSVVASLRLTSGTSTSLAIAAIGEAMSSSTSASGSSWHMLASLVSVGNDSLIIGCSKWARSGQLTSCAAAWPAIRSERAAAAFMVNVRDATADKVVVWCPGTAQMCDLIGSSVSAWLALWTSNATQRIITSVHPDPSNRRPRIVSARRAGGRGSRCYTIQDTLLQNRVPHHPPRIQPECHCERGSGLHTPVQRCN